MKTLVISLLIVTLVSCGKDGSSSKKNGPTLDPITQDKFEQYLRALAPGMVSTETTFGTDLDYTRDINGNWSVFASNANSLTKEIVLNVSGDAIYTLVEENFEAENRQTTLKVKKESLTLLAREYTQPLPPGFTYSIKNNKLVVNGSMSIDWELDTGVMLFETARVSMSVNLDDIRCTQNSSQTVTGKITQNGTTSAIPQTSSTDVGGCGTTLSAAQLGAIDLSDMTFCDESTGNDESECQYNQDLSYLVQ